jgi:hypothetical protein
VLHLHDFAESDAYRNRGAIPTAAVEAGGVRSVLIALSENFAAQAVIAMENAGSWVNCGRAPTRLRN